MPLSSTPSSRSPSAMPPINIRKIFPIPKCTHTEASFALAETAYTSYPGSAIPASSHAARSLIPYIVNFIFESSFNSLIYSSYVFYLCLCLNCKSQYISKFSKNLLTIATMLFCFFCILLLTFPALTRK